MEELCLALIRGDSEYLKRELCQSGQPPSQAFQCLDGYSRHAVILDCACEETTWWFHQLRGRLTTRLVLRFANRAPVRLRLIGTLLRGEEAEWEVAEWRLRGDGKWSFDLDLPPRIFVEAGGEREAEQVVQGRFAVETLRPFPGVEGKTIVVATPETALKRTPRRNRDWAAATLQSWGHGYEVAIFTGSTCKRATTAAVEWLQGAPLPKASALAFREIRNLLLRSPEQEKTEGCVKWCRVLEEPVVERSPEEPSEEQICQVIGKRFEYLSADPHQAQAVILASLMSLRGAQLAFEFRARNPLAVLRNSNAYAKRNMKHFVWMPPEFQKEDPFAHPARMFYGTIDEMYGYEQDRGLAIGWCGSLAHFYVTMLRLNGIGQDAVLEAYSGRHVLLFVRLGTEEYLLENHNIRRWGKDQVHYLQDLSIVANDSFALTSAGKSAGRQEYAALAQSFSSYWSHFDIGGQHRECARAVGEFKLPADLSVCNTDSPEELHRYWRERVFNREASDPVTCGLAMYAYQTLLVPRPEMYGKVAVFDPLAQLFARKFRRPDEVVKWAMALVEPASPFLERDRVLMPHQAIRFRKGGDVDRALLSFAVLRNMQIPASVRITDAGAFLTCVAEDGRSVYFDMTTGAATNECPGRVVLQFDENEHIRNRGEQFESRSDLSAVRNH